MNIRITLEGTDQLKFDPPANWDPEAREFVAAALVSTLTNVEPGFVVTGGSPEVAITVRPTTLATWNAAVAAVRAANCRPHPQPDVQAWVATLT